MDRREFLMMATSAAVLPWSRDVEGTTYVPTDSLVGTSDTYEPWLEIRCAHLIWNAERLSSHCGNRPVLAVLKDNAYGHGIEGTARCLEGVSVIHGFAVVKISEALALRKAGIQKPVLLMGPTSRSELLECLNHEIMPALFWDESKTLAEFAAQQTQRVKMHFYLDTGMGRVGIPYYAAMPLVEKYSLQPGIEIDGTMTELTEVDSADRLQIGRFLEFAQEARKKGINLGRLHAASSHAVLNLKNAHLDMIRPGLALYGGYSGQGVDLKQTLRFMTRVILVKRLRPGDWLQYGKAYVATKPVWVATLPMGYVDGLPTKAVGNGSVLIRGKKYPLIAKITANHALIEVGDEPTVSPGDEAVIIGESEGQSIEAQTLATQAGVSLYTLLMQLNPGLCRHYL